MSFSLLYLLHHIAWFCLKLASSLAAFEMELLTAVSKLQLTLDGLVSDVDSQRKLLFRMSSSGGSSARASAGDDVSEMLENINLPLSTMDQVDELELKLSAKDTRDSLVGDSYHHFWNQYFSSVWVSNIMLISYLKSLGKTLGNCRKIYHKLFSEQKQLNYQDLHTIPDCGKCNQFRTFLKTFFLNILLFIAEKLWNHWNMSDHDATTSKFAIPSPKSILKSIKCCPGRRKIANLSGWWNFNNYFLASCLNIGAKMSSRICFDF